MTELYEDNNTGYISCGSFPLKNYTPIYSWLKKNM